MIQSNFDVTSGINWAILVALGLLLSIQAWFILRNSRISRSRKIVRAGLNGLLWLLMVGYVVQPIWPSIRPARHALLVGDAVPGAVARRVSDSLHIQERVNGRNLTALYDSVTLLGQDFPVPTLSRLCRPNLNWIPYPERDNVWDIRWKGLLRQGEMQRVTGQIWSATAQKLTLQYAGHPLDSAVLHAGPNTFALAFPVFSVGRTQTELALNGKPLDTLRFFSSRVVPLTIRFVLNNPDFESKTLADWLGRQGHRVQLAATLSTNSRSQVTINATPGVSANATPDLLITDPANAGSASVRNAIAGGKSVLFLGLTTPEVNCRAINQALGSRFQLRRVSTEALVKLSPMLTALPFTFSPALNQFPVTAYPVAMQQTSGRVGVSLLNETFPLQLSGDSVAYARLWHAVLARLQAPAQPGLHVDAPIFPRIRHSLIVNSPLLLPPTLHILGDTIRVLPSPINPASATGYFTAAQSGWQPLADSLAIWVEHDPAWREVRQQRLVSHYIQAHQVYGPKAGQTEQQRLIGPVDKLPNWAWLLLLGVGLSALWIEPKVE